MKTNNLTNWPYYSNEEKKIVTSVLSSGKVNYWTGKLCKEFEKNYAEYVGTKFAISVANGTVALELALRSLNISKGDEVVVTPRSYVASASSVVSVGAKPIFSDVSKDTGNIDLENLSKVVTSKTKAVICVHIMGLPCDMDKIVKYAKNKKIFIIEDCSQAHGAEYKGRRVGSIGDIGTWSFCQDKIISTGGEGGMITTNSKKYWEHMWRLKDHGKNLNKLSYKNNKEIGFKWVHDDFGSNFRMTEMQAAIGIYQLKLLNKWQKKREANANKIIKVFKKYKGAISFFDYPKYSKHAWYRCCILINQQKLKKGWSRDKLIKEITRFKVPCFIGPCPEIYLERSFKNAKLKPLKRLNNAHLLGKKSLAFLVHPTLNKADINQICSTIDKVMSRAVNM